MTKALRVVGTVYLVLAALFIAANYALIWWFQGFWKLTEIVSPFNVINWLVTLVTVAPGLLLLAWAGRRERKASAVRTTPPA